MKHTIIVFAALQLSTAHAALIAPTRVSLPGVRAPQIAINPRHQLPTPTVPVLPLTTVRLTPAPIVVPGAFNPNSPITFPAPTSENSGKVVAQLSALFDGASQKEVPAVPTDNKAEKAAPSQKDAPVVRAERGNSHMTLPENDLLREIGF